MNLPMKYSMRVMMMVMAAESATAIEQQGTHPATVAAVPPELSAAHQRSRFANIDPVYDATALTPKPDINAIASLQTYNGPVVVDEKLK